MPKAPVKNFTFKFHKTNDFKTVKVDGIFGGLTIKREINMNFFVDAVEAPKTIIHSVSGNRIGEPIPMDPTITSGIREMPFGVIIDLNVAKATVLWLNEQIKQAEMLQKEVLDSQKTNQNTTSL